MGYHYGRYQPPPATPVLVRARARELALPDPSDHGALRVPPPPADAARMAELDVVHRFAALRTPAVDQWVEHMDHRGATSMWWGTAQRARADAAGPIAGVLRSVELRAALVGGQLGALAATYTPFARRYDRPRPFAMDPSIELVGARPGTSSYPSGHTRQAFASARIVARLSPGQADDAWLAARDVAASRVVAGAHLPSDVAAGARLGVAVGDAVVGAVHAARVGVPVAGAAAITLAALQPGDEARDSEQ